MSAAESPGFRLLFEGSKSDPFLVVYKPRGLPSAPLEEDETETALSQVLAAFPQLRLVCGKKAVEHGLLHRLDTETAGLLLIAATQEAFDALAFSQNAGLFVKKYTALGEKISGCGSELPEGFPPPPFTSPAFPLAIKSLFRPYGKRGAAVRPVVEAPNGREKTFAQKKAGSAVYETIVESCLPCGQKIFRFECRLDRGFRHQIRCHLAWLGYPILGDSLYGRPAAASGGNSGGLQLYAHSIEFPHPLTGKKCVFSVPAPTP